MIALLLATLWTDAEPALVDPEPYFRRAAIDEVALSPDGLLILARSFRDGDERIEVIDPRSGTRHELANNGDGVSSKVDYMAWAGKRTVVVRARASVDRPFGYWILRFTFEDGQFAGVMTREIYRQGVLVDPLPTDDNHVLFYYPGDHRGRGEGVYRLLVTDNGIPREEWRTKRRVNRTDAQFYLADLQGRLRLGIEYGEDEHRLLYLGERNRRFRGVYRFSPDVIFQPVYLNAEGNKMFVVTDEHRDRSAAMIFDLETGDYGSVLYEHPDYDVESIVVNPLTKEPLGVTFVAAGRVQRHYFDSSEHDAVPADHPSLTGRSTYIVDRDQNNANRLLWAESSSDPGGIYYLAADDGTVFPVSEFMPWMADRRFGSVRFISGEREGVEIEAYLTMPPQAADLGRIPLVVFPHGGPLAARDMRHFDPTAQFLASIGVAVLQVNFRGSGGFGKAFLEAGKREWGRGIEDDIDHMADLVLGQAGLDRERVCVFGASYGGYSAMMSLVRSPSRYRCAASYAGPTDLPLLFASSDWNQNTRLVREMLEIIGDPREHMDELLAHSPVYQAQSIERPLFLAHGEYDPRVDIEHFERMRKVMETLGKPLVTMHLENEGHGLAKRDNQIRYFTELARFLGEHLEIDLRFAEPSGDDDLPAVPGDDLASPEAAMNAGLSGREFSRGESLSPLRLDRKAAGVYR